MTQRMSHILVLVCKACMSGVLYPVLDVLNQCTSMQSHLSTPLLCNMRMTMLNQRFVLCATVHALRMQQHLL